MTTRRNAPKNSSSVILATDLDGTLIPLNGNEQNRIDLGKLSAAISEYQVALVFVTGRHLQSVETAIETYGLPTPDWIICDVGTLIYGPGMEGSWEILDDYALHLQSNLGLESIAGLMETLSGVQDLRLQENEKQGRFKLSYYCDARRLQACRESVATAIIRSGHACEIIASVDPFNGDGLIDVLPASVSKAFALRWWTRHCNFADQSVIFAGDSGNDLAAMTAGYRTIVVGNADRALANEVQLHHQSQGWQNRIHLAKAPATSGVWEGCHFFQTMKS